MIYRAIYRKIIELMDEYVRLIRESANRSWENVQLDLNHTQIYEVLGGLLFRQVSLVTQLALSPRTWNPHVGPILIRSMVETCITLGWIKIDPLPRSRQFIEYGLGQEKLSLEHIKADITERGDNPNEDDYVNSIESWINSQRYTYFIEVNVGNWSGSDLRKMSESVGMKKIYDLVYSPASAAIHSSWHHIARWNLKYCDNALHRYHRVPDDPNLGINFQYMRSAADIMEETLNIFDGFCNCDASFSLAYRYMNDGFDEISAQIAELEMESNDNVDDALTNGAISEAPEQ